jgi:hypothetical protein
MQQTTPVPTRRVVYGHGTPFASKNDGRTKTQLKFCYEHRILRTRQRSEAQLLATDPNDCAYRGGLQPGDRHIRHLGDGCSSDQCGESRILRADAA